MTITPMQAASAARRSIRLPRRAAVAYATTPAASAAGV